MKVVRADSSVGDVDLLLSVSLAKWSHTVNFYRNYSLLILKYTFQQQKLFRQNKDAIVVEQIGSDDRVADSGLIFKTEKYKSLRGAWSLPRYDASGCAYAPAIRNLYEISCRKNACLSQFITAIGERMRSYSESGSMKI